MLWLFPIFEIWIDNIRHVRTYELTFTADSEELQRLESLFNECRLKITDHWQMKKAGKITCARTTQGSPWRHDKLTRALINDLQIEEFHY